MAINPTTENILAGAQFQGPSLDKTLAQAFPTPDASQSGQGGPGGKGRARSRAAPKIRIPNTPNRYLRGMVSGFRQKKSW